MERELRHDSQSVAFHTVRHEFEEQVGLLRTETAFTHMQIIGVVGYCTTALAFSLLGALVFVNWKASPIGAWLVAACAITTVWGGLLALDIYRPIALVLIYAGEFLRMGIWIAVLVVVAQPILPNRLRRLIYLVWLGAVVVNLLMWLIQGRAILSADTGNQVFLAAGLVLSLLGLVLLEQLYRSASQDMRAAIKYFVMAVGMILAYDLFMYAQGVMFNEISGEVWAIRGFIVAASVPLFVIAARRHAEWSIDLFVSRQVVFHTATFSAVGVYLCLMALGGYYVRFVGVRWASLAQFVFFVGTGIVLAWLLSSAALRRHLKVFISKHFYSNKYDYREQWVQFIQTLSNTEQNNVSRTALQAVAQAIESPGGLLYWLEDGGRKYELAASWSAEPTKVHQEATIATEDELIRFLDRRHWIIDLMEYRKSPEVYDNALLPEWLGQRPEFRIVSPILYQGRLHGFFVLHSPPGPFQLSYEDRDLLRTLGITIAIYLAQHEGNRKLAEARQLEVFSRLTAFMMHDLKNAAAQLSLVVRNAEKHRKKPEFIDDAMSTIAGAANRIENLIAQLHGTAATERTQKVLLDHVVDHAVTRCLGRAPVPVVHFADEDLWVRADPERLISVCEHLLRNAQQATPENGEVRVELTRCGKQAAIRISDNGSGMTPEFIRDRLFRPFDSTKGGAGMGIGAYQAREYVLSLGGDLHVVSEVGSGTCMEVRLALADSDSPLLGARQNLA